MPSPRRPVSGSAPSTSSREGSRTSARTWSPRSTSARAIAPPRKPGAPVTSTRVNRGRAAPPPADAAPQPPDQDPLADLVALDPVPEPLERVAGDEEPERRASLP